MESPQKINNRTILGSSKPTSLLAPLSWTSQPPGLGEINFCCLNHPFIYLLAASHSMWDLSSLTRDQICVPCIRRRSLNHWTTREIPKPPFSYGPPKQANTLLNLQSRRLQAHCLLKIVLTLL